MGPVISLENNFIKGPPTKKTIINEVIRDKPVLKVRYLKHLEKKSFYK